jgi:hypothetical protein
VQKLAQDLVQVTPLPLQAPLQLASWHHHLSCLMCLPPGHLLLFHLSPLPRLLLLWRPDQLHVAVHEQLQAERHLRLPECLLPSGLRLPLQWAQLQQNLELTLHCLSC